nr:retrovirus-related Pol polyprotein from transposon TNT 1-94 [Tanacetum cinerariifolium]
MYLHKVKECDCLAQKLSKQTEFVSKKVKNDTVCNEKASNVFQKEREKYFKIQDLKAQMQDKNIAIRVNHQPNVSRPQLKSNQSRDKVLPNNSQVEVKKTQVEVHPRIPSVSNKIKSVTACKDSLNSRTLNANAVCATCNKCLVDSNHFACVTKMLNDVHARTKKPTVVPINTRKPKSQAYKSVATHNTKKIIQLIIFIVDSGCTKHMTSNLKLLCNFVEMFLGIVRFGNDQFAPILRYGDLVQGNVTINRVYYVKYLNHNLFSVGQFCDADLEVTFRKSTCFVRDIQGNDLLVGNHGSDLYIISLQESTSSTPLCLMAKATPTQAWLWHRRLSHLNFDYINLLSKKDIVIGLPKLKYVKDQLCSSCELSKAKKKLIQVKSCFEFERKAKFASHGIIWSNAGVASINGKKSIMVIIDDYSRYTWTLFLRSKDEMPEVLKDFLTMIQRNLQALVITVNTKRCTEFLNKTLNAYFKEEGIEHQTLTARTPEHNGIVERRNRLVPQRQKASDYDNPDPIPPRQDVSSSADADVPSQQELDLLFGPLYDEFFIVGSNPSTNIQSTSAPSTHTNVHAEENNNDQAEEGEHVQDDEFTNPLCALAQEEAESSSHNVGNSNVPTFNQPHVSEYRWTKDHPLEQVRRNPSRPVQTRRQLATDAKMCMFALTVSTAEPKNLKEAMADSAWIKAMQEELHQFDILQVWELVDKPYGKSIIKLKWLWKNQKDKDQTVIRNKVRLIAKGTQVFSNFSDGRENGFSQWSTEGGGLQIHQSPSSIFINQAKYTLEILHKHGMDKGQSIGTPMATKPKLDADLSGNPVDQTDYRSKIRSLMYLTSSRPDIVQADSSFELIAFSDVDHAECIDSHKSTSGGIQFLGDKLVSWMSKKQNCTAMSSAEAEYVALSMSCAQVMWMRTQLQDYAFNYNKIPLYCNSQSAIAISCNPVQHSHTKHIYTQYHFIKEQVENGIIELYFVRTEYQLADMFTKALPEDRFKYLVRRIGMRCLTPA